MRRICVSIESEYCGIGLVSEAMFRQLSEQGKINQIFNTYEIPIETAEALEIDTFPFWEFPFPCPYNFLSQFIIKEV